MKHKPILTRKLAKDGSGGLREVIGLMGSQAGTGVTYTGLMLAFYLSEELGKKTAFLECNNHQDMDLIQKAYEWSSEETASFCFRNLTCYKRISPKQIPDIIGQDFDYIIIDFGTDWLGNREEFLRCSLKAVFAGRSEWGLQKLLSFIRNNELTRGSDTWYYLIPQAEDRMIKRFKKETYYRICAVPYTDEPTRPNRSTRQFFKELLRLA